MHEYSIVQSLLNLCEENAQKNNATKVEKLTVKIGKLSGVEPHLLEIAFETFKEQTICQEAKFEMIIQDVVIKCNKCNTTTTLEENIFCCPHCQSYDVDVIDGEEMFLMSLQMS